MPKESAGCLLYKLENGELSVLLVHPSGNYNKKTPWTIPKGLVDDNEEKEAAARRETREETGVEAGELVSLGVAIQGKSRKHIYCFAGESPSDAAPVCASWEVDRSEFVSIEAASKLIHPDQLIFLEKLLEHLKETISRL